MEGWAKEVSCGGPTAWMARGRKPTDAKVEDTVPRLMPVKTD